MNTNKHYAIQTIWVVTALTTSPVASYGQQVNSILCRDRNSDTKVSKIWKITIQTDLVCSLVWTNDDTLMSQLESVANKNKYDEIIVILFPGMDLWNDRLILKFDTFQKKTGLTVYYLYDRKYNTLKSLSTDYLAEAIKKANAKK